MKFTYTQGNLKDIGKDAKDLGKATAHLIKDTFKLPLSIGKDVRVAHKESMSYRELIKLIKSGKATVTEITLAKALSDDESEVEAAVKEGATQPA